MTPQAQQIPATSSPAMQYPATQTPASTPINPQLLQQLLAAYKPQTNSALQNAQGLQNMPQSDPSQVLSLGQQPQSTILPYLTNVTQMAGNYNPGLEKFSGGVALDTNFAAGRNTPVSLPPGKWQIVSSYAGAGEGQPGDSTNEGYGNSIRAKNVQTGEMIHVLHLGKVGVRQGQIVPGGQVVATSGNSGNSTGPNLGIEYYDQNGQLGSILNSPYAPYIMPQK